MVYKARIHIEYLREFLSNDEMIYDPPFGGKFITTYADNLILLTHNNEFEFNTDDDPNIFIKDLYFNTYGHHLTNEQYELEAHRSANK